MDTPERNKIGTPMSKFEDSPVFNYINSLSPIKPVKSIHITQTFSSLTFASIPSIFTSPHVSSHKESRFLRRHQFSDSSKLKFLSENGNKDCTNEVVVVDASQLFDNSTELQENLDPRISIGEASVEQPSECVKFPIELPQTLNYDCGSPDCSQTPCGIGTNWVSKLASTSASLVPFVQKASKKGSSEGEHLPGICWNEQKKEGSECELESLFSDAADLLIFDFQNDMEDLKGLIQKSLDPGVSLCTPVSELLQGVIEDVQNTLLVDPVGSGDLHEIENSPCQTGEAIQLKEMDQTQEDLTISNLSRCMASKQSEKMGNEPVSNLHRGMRRRCLDFEMVGVRRKDLADGSNCSSSMILRSDEKIASNDKQLVAIKSGSDSSRSILPVIGLHLNALAKNSKDYKNAENETVSSERQLNIPSSSASFHFPTTGQETLHKSLASVSSERDADPTENGLQLVVDSSEASAYLASEEFNQSSPKRKRRRLEHAGENEACKRCNCKKSKCLKLYCECFAAGVYCIEPCSCLECFNKPIHEDTVLATRKQIESRNPLAFAPKVIRSSDSAPEIGDESITTPASARHKRGCNCKKSSCLKKYCECFQGGVGCSVNCRCEGCKNAFGRKYGSAPIGTELEPEGEETETCEKNEVDNNLQKTEIQNNEEHNPASALPTTPLQLCGPLLQLPFSTKGKPPRTSSAATGSSSGLHPIHKFVKRNFYQPPPKFENHFQTVPEDEMPEILRGNCSPSTGIKTASPNSKRVSPPHYDFGSSPRQRSGRKLILKSIPSFPSLTPQH